MASNDFKDAIKNVADTLAGYVKDASTLTVETSTVEVGSGGTPTLAARTVISLDGDNSTTIPASKDANGKWSVENSLYELHMQNVQAAVDYRARILGAMMGMLQSR